jgi:hypothetical protein
LAPRPDLSLKHKNLGTEVISVWWILVVLAFCRGGVSDVGNEIHEVAMNWGAACI